jgi:hypothetical protein
MFVVEPVKKPYVVTDDAPDERSAGRKGRFVIGRSR